MKNKKAFTLAETLIVLVVLGIVASITIPPLVRRQIEASNRVKIKKAMGVYETLLAKIAVENDIKTTQALKEWGEQTDENGVGCVNQRNYFKVVKGEGCQFMNTDKVWWDVSDITHPKIALKEGELDTASKTTFTLLGHFGQNGELRVDDLAYEEQNATGADLIAIMNLYSFINNDESKKTNVGDVNFINALGYNLDDYDQIDYDEQGRIISFGEYNINYDDENKIAFIYTTEYSILRLGGSGGYQFATKIGTVYNFNGDKLYDLQQKYTNYSNNIISKVFYYTDKTVIEKYDDDGNLISTTTTANENSNSGNSGSGRLLQ